MTLDDWSRAYPQAAAALAAITLPPPTDPTSPGSEGRAQSLIRLEAPRHGYKMFRNNVGVMLDKDEQGRIISATRFGLANDTEKLNDKV